MNSNPPMPPAYFETHFRTEAPHADWPAEFAIITAYATTGEQWTVHKSEAADRQLEAELRQTGRRLHRLTGYSPVTGHAEPGWAVDMPMEAACEMGRHFKQDAIYIVIDDALSVTFCNPLWKSLVPVDSFRKRLTASTSVAGATSSHPHAASRRE